MQYGTKNAFTSILTSFSQALRRDEQVKTMPMTPYQGNTTLGNYTRYSNYSTVHIRRNCYIQQRRLRLEQYLLTNNSCALFVALVEAEDRG
jgi:hypothetical protein